MEINDFNDSALDESLGTNQAEGALLRMIASASSLELKQAFDEYLAILDRSGLADVSSQEGQNSKNSLKTIAQGGAD